MGEASGERRALPLVGVEFIFANRACSLVGFIGLGPGVSAGVTAVMGRAGCKAGEMECSFFAGAACEVRLEVLGYALGRGYGPRECFAGGIV